MKLDSTDSAEELISVYFRQLKWLRDALKRRISSHELTEDALQETWLRLASLKSKPPEIRDQRAFILRIAGNIAIDLLRKDRRHNAVCISDEDVLAAIADSYPSPETFALDRDNLRQLVIALMQISQKARSALLLARCDGLSHREIAEQLGVSESMVARYLAQALRHCRDHFRNLQ
ncbi:RNA polymerase sigma factor [Ochrobactrum sp. MYb379]|uniref:RNA polymerase sigma factor n=1 Tax=Ochrobactrum sp. MYb379 TaxID=2745275 RepID=UPI0030A24A5D